MTGNQVPPPEPGNETAPDAKERRSRRPKLQDLPNMRGPGVGGQEEDAELEALGDEMDELVTKKRKLAEKITAVDGKAQERLATLGLKSYRYSDREIYLKEGKDHVKTRVIKADQNGESEHNGNGD
jgi:hypothetical protein